MKDSMLTIFPESMVTKRWTKDANVSKAIPSCEEYPDKALQLARYSEMMAECAQICYVSSFSNENYEDTINDLRRMTIKSRTYWEGKDQSKECHVDGLRKNVIRDPVVCRTKGTQPKQHTTDEHVNIHNKEKSHRGCKKCGKPGHNQRTWKTHSQDRKMGEIGGGPKKHKERCGPRPNQSTHPTPISRLLIGLGGKLPYMQRILGTVMWRVIPVIGWMKRMCLLKIVPIV